MTVIAKKVKIAIVRRSGGMADAHGSGPCGSNIVRVQVPSSAPTKKDAFWRPFSICNQTQRKSPKHVIFGWLFNTQPNFTIFIEITRMRRPFGEEVYYEYR